MGAFCQQLVPVLMEEFSAPALLNGAVTIGEDWEEDGLEDVGWLSWDVLYWKDGDGCELKLERISV